MVAYGCQERTRGAADAVAADGRGAHASHDALPHDDCVCVGAGGDAICGHQCMGIRSCGRDSHRGPDSTLDCRRKTHFYGPFFTVSQGNVVVCQVHRPYTTRAPNTQDFRRIASFLPDRTTADCVQFYYKFQKGDEFSLVRRKQQLKKRRLHSDMKRNPNYMGMGAMGRPPPAPERGVGGRGRDVPAPPLRDMEPPPPGVRSRGRARGRTTRRQAELLEDTEVHISMHAN